MSFRYTLCARNDVARPEALRVDCPKQTLEPEGIYVPSCLQEMPHPMLCCPHATHTCISSHTLDDLHGRNSNRIGELCANRIQATNGHHRLHEGQGHALFQGTTLALPHPEAPLFTVSFLLPNSCFTVDCIKNKSTKIAFNLRQFNAIKAVRRAR